MRSFALSLVLALALPTTSALADSHEAEPSEGNLDAYVEVLRSDVRASKTALMTQALELTDGESAAFWPVYREYDAELAKIWDRRLALIKEYAGSHGSIDAEQADDMANRLLRLEEDRLKLRRDYFKKIKKTVPAQKAVRWLQVENRVGMLIDLKIASELPLLR